VIPENRSALAFTDIVAALGPGPGRPAFEKAVAAMAQATYGLAFPYAHAGVMALFKALKWTGVEIILPAYTCEVMAEIIVATGNTPVFVDIDLADYNMDPKAVRAALTRRTRAVMPMHMFGYPAAIGAIRQAVSDENILIIEDAAMRPYGATPGDSQLQGDVGLVSFGPGKQLYTVRGGVLVTNLDEIYHKLKTYRDQEMSQLPPREWAKRWVRLLITYFSQYPAFYRLARRVGLANPGSIPAALNATLGSAIPPDYATAYANFQANLGLAQLKKLPAIVAKRRAWADFYQRELAGQPGLTLAPVIPGGFYVYYTVRVRDRDARGFYQAMRSRGIQVGLNYDYALPDWKNYGKYARGQYPNALQAAREVVNLPNYATLAEAEARSVVQSVRQLLQTDAKQSYPAPATELLRG
jgi:dTDP-4-amino-4,6-dideoxygalactose transaminase